MTESNHSEPRPADGGDAGGAQTGKPHCRRVRYPGTHPRRFEHRYKELAAGQYPGIVEHIRAQGRTPAGMHVPIMVHEVLAALAPAPGEIVADCTLGGGGHATEFMRRIGPSGRLVGFDVDAAQLERTRERLAGMGVPITLVRGNFAGLGKVLGQDGVEGYDIIFADLGVSSVQIDDPARGFSYKHDGPLDMRMDSRLRRTAADLLATMRPDELSTALFELADEEDHDAIAAAIAGRRAEGPITRTMELVEAIMRAKRMTLRQWRQKRGTASAGPVEGEHEKQSSEIESGTHPAARTFQALRIMVNDELGSLKALLRTAPFCLRPGGRIGIIAFHSGEDRLVKKAFQVGLDAGHYAGASEEPLRPSAQEVRYNPRSRPAKFRWARKT